MNYVILRTLKKTGGNCSCYSFGAIVNLQCHHAFFIQQRGNEPAWYLFDQSFLLLLSHSRWTEQFSRDTKRYHFPAFIIQFVSDNPLVIFNSPLPAGSNKGSFHYMAARLAPAHPAAELTCHVHLTVDDLPDVRASNS